MVDILGIVRSFIENDIIRTVLIYYVISVSIWAIFLFIVSRDNNSKFYSSYSDGVCRKSRLLWILIFFFLIFLFVRSMNYVGYLPHGQDTSAYTYHVKDINVNGYWRGEEGYYKLYHTSAVFLALMNEIVGSIEIAYIILVIIFILSLIFSVGIVTSKILRVKVWFCIFMSTLLFIITPNLGGFDLLQQYVSIVYAILGILIFFILYNNLPRYVCFIILITISVVTHLTSFITCLILLAMYVVDTKVYRTYGMGFLISLFIAISYLFFCVNPKSIVLSLYKTLNSLLAGTVGAYTIRALTEVSASLLFLFSWVLLPSIVSAYLLVSFIVRSVGNDNIHRLIITASSFSLGTLLMGVLTGVSIYLVRYFALPSYAVLFFSTSILLIKIFKRTTKKWIFVCLLIILLIPYIYSAVNSDARSPWVGEPRLGPTTRTDRVEMLFLAKCGVDGYSIYVWHDVYVPYEDVGRRPYLLSSWSYYQAHDVLISVSKDEMVNIPKNSYLVPLKEIMSAERFDNYNIVYNGYQHLMMVPK